MTSFRSRCQVVSTELFPPVVIVPSAKIQFPSLGARNLFVLVKIFCIIIQQKLLRYPINIYSFYFADIHLCSRIFWHSRIEWHTRNAGIPGAPGPQGQLGKDGAKREGPRGMTGRGGEKKETKGHVVIMVHLE